MPWNNNSGTPAFTYVQMEEALKKLPFAFKDEKTGKIIGNNLPLGAAGYNNNPLQEPVNNAGAIYIRASNDNAFTREDSYTLYTRLEGNYVPLHSEPIPHSSNGADKITKELINYYFQLYKDFGLANYFDQNSN